MNLLRDHWRRSALRQYFEGLDPVDRATWLIGVALAFAAALSLDAIARAWSVNLDTPSFTAPPFDMRVAEVGR
ncbi:hypothetical protein [Bradyrhizobium sp.]|uniref:hypothetical protein n=1 Tax=Bradyrhizobium sp. TaxID=376 RepID=UPI0039E5EA6D